MSHKVFISYAKEDTDVSNKVCNALEAAGIRCWMAPRDILAGMHYAEAIIDAISSSSVILLIISKNANNSDYIAREVERSVSKGLFVFALRIEEVELSRDLEFFISIAHWFEASEGDIDLYSESIAVSMRDLLNKVEQKEAVAIVEDDNHKEDAYLPVLSWQIKTKSKLPFLILNIFKKAERIYRFSLRQSAEGKPAFEKPYKLSISSYDFILRAISETIKSNVDINWSAFARAGNIIYRFLLPPEIQQAIDNHKGAIILETEDLSIPWDLLHDQKEFLCKNKPFARIPVSYRWAETVFKGNTLYDFELKKALLISSPLEEWPGIESDALELQHIFQDNGVACDSLVGPSQCSYVEIKEKLRKGVYAFIHITGTLRYLPDRQTSAIALANDQLLLSEEIGSLLRGNPFVFLNTLHDTVTTDEKEIKQWKYGPLNTRSMVQAFIYGGNNGNSKAVIGSLYGPRDMKVSNQFIKTFYRGILKGMTVGEAMHQGRNQKGQNGQEIISGLGFVLFGDLNLSLHSEVPKKLNNVHEQPEDTGHGAINDNPWSDDVRVAFFGAIASMTAMNWRYLSTIHLMLGLTYLPKGLLSMTLADNGYDPNAARRKLRKLMRQERSFTAANDIKMSNNLVRCLESAKKLSASCGAKQVDEKHLLWAILNLKKSGILAILSALKIDLETSRIAIEIKNFDLEQISPIDLFNEEGGLNFNLFGEDCIRSLENAVKATSTTNWDNIRTPHLFIGMLNRKGSILETRTKELGIDSQLLDFFTSTFMKSKPLEINVLSLREDHISENTKILFRKAYKLSAVSKRFKIEEKDLLEAMLSAEDSIVRKILDKLKIDISCILGRR